MLPGQFDLNLYRGDSASYSFNLWHDTDKSLPVDLSGATAMAQIREKPDSGAVIGTVICTVVLPNTITVMVLNETSAALKTKAAWDLQLTWQSGDVQTVLAGAVYVTADVTR